eukprot:8541595-Ditylum_brightwellii.AAC.1
MDRANKHKTPEASTTVLAKDIDGEEREENWNYRAMASHETAVKQIVRYLMQAKNSREYGLIMEPDKNKGLEVHVDASFSGDWNKLWSEEQIFVLSRT